ncbi:MAG TPA: site-2 protease family protein [Longimicrobiaceae bacterium]|nr:site-2 protease family protein [Longimicrobiaceae bacterium]
MVDWVNVFATYRVVPLRREEIVQGVLLPGLAADSPPVRSLLESWPGARFVRETPMGTEVTLFRRTVPPVPERWWLHALLFLLTFLTTTLSGAMFAGRDAVLLRDVQLGPWAIPLPGAILPAQLVPGLWFSLPLLAVLLAHEMGHYLVAKRRGLDVSPPYFIPAPFPLNLIGTFGAFIRLRSPMINRALLLDVGAAGPLASFVLSLPLAAAGLGLSSVGETTYDTPTRFLVPIGTEAALPVGGSLVFHALAAAFAPGPGTLVLHPLALAAWLGLFVTALNLFPLSQLDGGHVLFALAGRRQRLAALAFLALLIVLGFHWAGWWMWAGLVLLVGRGSVAHPPVFDPAYPLSPARRLVAWACIAMLVLSFVPVPFAL